MTEDRGQKSEMGAAIAEAVREYKIDMAVRRSLNYQTCCDIMAIFDQATANLGSIVASNAVSRNYGYEFGLVRREFARL